MSSNFYLCDFLAVFVKSVGGCLQLRSLWLLVLFAGHPHVPQSVARELQGCLEALFLDASKVLVVHQVAPEQVFGQALVLQHVLDRDLLADVDLAGRRHVEVPLYALAHSLVALQDCLYLLELFLLLHLLIPILLACIANFINQLLDLVVDCSRTLFRHAGGAKRVAAFGSLCET